jgi:hypothetical protein
MRKKSWARIMGSLGKKNKNSKCQVINKKIHLFHKITKFTKKNTFINNNNGNKCFSRFFVGFGAGGRKSIK